MNYMYDLVSEPTYYVDRTGSSELFLLRFVFILLQGVS